MSELVRSQPSCGRLCLHAWRGNGLQPTLQDGCVSQRLFNSAFFPSSAFLILLVPFLLALLLVLADSRCHICTVSKLGRRAAADTSKASSVCSAMLLCPVPGPPIDGYLPLLPRRLSSPSTAPLEMKPSITMWLGTRMSRGILDQVSSFRMSHWFGSVSFEDSPWQSDSGLESSSRCCEWLLRTPGHLYQGGHLLHRPTPMPSAPCLTSSTR